MFAHLGLVIALAILAGLVSLHAACELIVIQLDAEAGLVGDTHASVFDRHPPTEDDLILLVLPWVMGIAGVGQMRRRAGNVRHRHERDAEMRVRMHGKSDA